MAAAGLELIATFALHESYVPAILKAKLKRRRKEQPNADLYTAMDITLDGEKKANTAAVVESASRPGLFSSSYGYFPFIY
ncbi:hypothetical protein O9K51_06506 [Purpureocillium lavendulum]|uniref:Uncharacterized protein n=1 Tax=Purpureocillium lavendulum TaxID=1247861 RepID=A0AB34FPD9_9HYPO|nr:hypothetical protein O9K51_06506 [Purpureocillium lavendulum]